MRLSSLYQPLSLHLLAPTLPPAGTVYRVREKESRQHCIIKVVQKSAVLGDDVKGQLQREIELHTRLYHPNIIRMYAYFEDKDCSE